MQKAQSDRQRYLSERDKLLGNLDIYGQQSDSLRKKLNGENYREIEKRYTRKNIELQTTELAVTDLKSYYDALDQSLQNFHSLKIKEINKIIRELWQTIYKGTDIEMIELESGQDAAQTGKATRSYNYRVVMKKGDYPLDMRGRCSAGQRVLASIVIRLALAETFCLNCGILTLDEPTTNLDEANKAGLAEALSRLIISRAKQQNFQLICNWRVFYLSNWQLLR
jgi:DNA repair protein RAD50